MITRHLIPSRPRFTAPLLFVHGAWHDSRCWNDAFLEQFTAAGWEVYTIDLPQHGQHKTGKSINRYSIGDYVTSVQEAVASIGREPVLIGHSMGGLVVQKYLERAGLKAAILIAPAPPVGVWEATRKAFQDYPADFFRANLTLNMKAIVSRPEQVRWAFYSDATDAEQLSHFTENIQPESYRAFLGMLFPRIRKKHHGVTQMLVVGGEKDHLFSPEIVKDTALFYLAVCVIVKDAPHNLMAEKPMELAAHMIEWLDERVGL